MSIPQTCHQLSTGTVPHSKPATRVRTAAAPYMQQEHQPSTLH